LTTSPDTDASLLHELLLGPIFYPPAAQRRPAEGNLGPRVVDAILAGFAPHTDDAR
jgi:hypothetical protein